MMKFPTESRLFKLIADAHPMMTIREFSELVREHIDWNNWLAVGTLLGCVPSDNETVHSTTVFEALTMVERVIESPVGQAILAQQEALTGDE